MEKKRRMKRWINPGKDINLLLLGKEQESIWTTIIIGQVQLQTTEQKVHELLIVEGIKTQRKSNVGVVMDFICKKLPSQS